MTEMQIQCPYCGLVLSQAASIVGHMVLLDQYRTHLSQQHPDENGNEPKGSA